MVQSKPTAYHMCLILAIVTVSQDARLGNDPCLSDHFDIVLVEELKLQRGNHLEKGQILKCPHWVVQPLMKLNHHRDLQDYTHWVSCWV